VENNSILVTGGLGFIGSNLVNYLVEQGHKVYYTGRNFEENKHKLSKLCIQRAKFIEWDLTNEIPISFPASIDYVYHLAGQTSHSYSLENPLIDLKVNVEASLRLLLYLKQIKFTGKFIYASSKGVTGIPEKLPVNEDSISKPIDFYSANKFIVEEYLRIFNLQFGLNYTILRVTNVYGPLQTINSPKKGILNFFIGLAIQGKDITIYGEGKQLRDYTYIDDCISALELIRTSNSTDNETYYLGSGIGTEFHTMAELVVKSVGKGGIRYIPYPRNAKSIEIGDFIVNNTKLKSIGWKPTVTLEDGIRKTVEYYSVNLDNYL